MHCDYHLHSEFSFDSSERIENICRKAIEEKISEIAITDHAEFPNREKAPWPDFEKRSEIISDCSKQFEKKLIIREGVEIGQPWRCSAPEGLPLSFHPDFVIASVHKIDSFPDPKTIHYSEDIVPGFVDAYLAQMIEMAENCDYDVLGHVTYLFRFIPEDLAVKFRPESFLDQYEKLFRAVIMRGKGIEVNCSGLRMPSIKNLMPSVQLLRLYKELGGSVITIGSDGHSCRSAFSGIAEGYRALIEAGFKAATRFEKRNALFYSII